MPRIARLILAMLGLACAVYGVVLLVAPDWEIVGDTTTTMMWISGSDGWDWKAAALLSGGLALVLVAWLARPKPSA